MSTGLGYPHEVGSPTVVAMLRARADDDNVGLLFAERSWTWREVVAESATRAAWMQKVLDPQRPPHVGVLLPTVPEYVFQIFGAALVIPLLIGRFTLSPVGAAPEVTAAGAT